MHIYIYTYIYIHTYTHAFICSSLHTIVCAYRICRYVLVYLSISLVRSGT